VCVSTCIVGLASDLTGFVLCVSGRNCVSTSQHSARTAGTA
jgi:hypothetical protein